MADVDYRGYWDRGFTWERYLADEVRTSRELWEGVSGRVRIPDWAVERVRATRREWRLLVLTEDWCGDAANTVPVIAGLAEAVEGVELRLLKRDENLELMDLYLTGASRSIPLAIVLDRGLGPVGRWGPRPVELQEFVLREKKAGVRPAKEIYRDARIWYARDRGETTLRELIGIMESAARPGG